MSSKSHHGFTLIEMIVAIAIISVAIVGAMKAFTQTTMNSADPVVRKQLLVVADEIMEEVQLKPYTDPYGRTKTITGCERSGFYQVHDYDGYTTTNKVCDVDGTPTADLANYTLKVVVAQATLNGLTTAWKITVTVSKGSETLTLVGWRLDYA